MIKLEEERRAKIKGGRFSMSKIHQDKDCLFHTLTRKKAIFRADKLVYPWMKRGTRGSLLMRRCGTKFVGSFES